MEGVGKGIGTVLLLLCLISLLVGIAGTQLLRKRAIRSDKPITPEIELVIKNNAVDTIYVYRKPKK